MLDKQTIISNNSKRFLQVNSCLTSFSRKSSNVSELDWFSSVIFQKPCILTIYFLPTFTFQFSWAGLLCPFPKGFHITNLRHLPMSLSSVGIFKPSSVDYSFSWPFTVSLEINDKTSCLIHQWLLLHSCHQ